MATNDEVYFCILIILIAGVSGIIFSSIAIDKAEKLKKQGNPSKRSMGSLIVMLIVSIIITLVALLYGIKLYDSKGKFSKRLRIMFSQYVY